MSINVGYIGVTNSNWLNVNFEKKHKQVLFWSTFIGPVNLDHGTPFFFFIAGERLIKGYGQSGEKGITTVKELWIKFKQKTGYSTLHDMCERINKSEDTEVSYNIVNDVKYIPQGIDPSKYDIQFHRCVVRGKKIDIKSANKLLNSNQ